MNELDRALQAISDHKKALAGVVVHLNDTYLIDARPERWLPGFARIVATIRRLRAHTIAATGEDLLLVVHSGDFLSPSRVGNYRDKATNECDHGQTMVKLLNAAGVNYCVLGNHEFDYKAKVLAARLREADFTVLLANTTDPTGLIKREDPPPGKRRIKMEEHVVWRPTGESPPRIALTGVVSADVHKSFVSPSETEVDPKTRKPKDVPWKDISPSQAVIKAWNDIKDSADDASHEQGDVFETKVALTDNIPFRFVLTHATQAEDAQLQREITATLPTANPRTYILGGHDHDIQYVDYSGTIFIGKNLSNAETIRVMLPLAGGRSACNEVYAEYQRLQERQPKKRFLYPQDLETVLLTVSELDRNVLRERIQEQGFDEGSELKDVLPEARCEYDIPAFELTYEDHDMSDVAADEIIQAAIAKVELPDDDDEVRNFTGQMPILEARDGDIRKRPTNMGVLVAECVRLEAEAQLKEEAHRPAGDSTPVVALINSGAFRCDSDLKPELKMRDLRETFLFDDEDAIMVLKESWDTVHELVRHGRQEEKKGTGAFPQLGGYLDTAKGEVWLAISSYLIRADNNDGYNEVLQKLWKLPDLEATAEAARKKAAKRKKAASDLRFSITGAVKENAKTVPVNELPKPEDKPVDGADEILKLLQTYLDAFHKNISPDDSNFPNKETWLESDDHIDQPAIRDARDAVRGFLEERCAVKKYKDVAASPVKGAQWNDEARVAWTNARKELLELRGSLRSKDDPAFSKGDSYFRLFNAAVRRIPGWGLLPPLI